MGARGTLGQVVYDYLNDGNDAYVLSADLAHASGFDRIARDYPKRLINVGIAEQNLIGVSAGLAKNGTPVIATTWGMFASVRVMDQVRNYLGYMQANVKLIGMDSGFAQGHFSYSHTNPPDIAVMRAIPGMTVLSPCDGLEIYKAIEFALEFQGPVYIRLTGGATLPMINGEDYNFEFGRAVQLIDGEDAAILTTGNVTDIALKAAKVLHEEGISVSVFNFHTLSHIDKDTLESLGKYKTIYTVEEHLLQGGFGSAIGEYLLDKVNRPVVKRLGVNNSYPKTGTVDYIYDMVGFSIESIVKAIRDDFGGLN